MALTDTKRRDPVMAINRAEIWFAPGPRSCSRLGPRGRNPRRSSCPRLRRSGYHPNVSAPGGTINFLWMMAPNRETEYRQFGVVNVHPDYAKGGSGLEASRK